MEYVIIVVCIGAVLAYMSVRRGRTTVRAAMYLTCLDDGFSSADANMVAQNTDFADAAKHQTSVLRIATAPYGGSQLRMIKAARLKGFMG